MKKGAVTVFQLLQPLCYAFCINVTFLRQNREGNPCMQVFLTNIIILISIFMELYRETGTWNLMKSMTAILNMPNRTNR